MIRTCCFLTLLILAVPCLAANPHLSGTPPLISLRSATDVMASGPLSRVLSVDEMLGPSLRGLSLREGGNLFGLMVDSSFYWLGDHWGNDRLLSFSYNPQGLLDEMLFQIWDSDLWSFSNQQSAVFTYDADSRVSTLVQYLWQENQWQPWLMDVLSYNPEGLVSQITSSTWVSGAWTLAVLDSFLYVSGSLLRSEEIIKRWESEQWVNVLRQYYSYNSHNQPDSVVQQGWESGAWKNWSRWVSLYDSLNHEVESIEQNWGLTGWANSSKNAYTYDSRGHRTIDLHSIWEMANWVPTDVDSMKYVGDRLVEVVHNYFAASQLRRTLYSYDLAGNQTGELGLRWEAASGWINETRESYVYSRLQFLCGDADASNLVNVSDVVFLIGYIFIGASQPSPLASGDADCSGTVVLTDAVYLVNFIFAGGPAPCATCPKEEL